MEGREPGAGSREPGAGSRELLLAQDLRQWLTVGFDRVVLVVGRTVTALTRLLDIVTLIETDHRVQVVFTTDPANAAIFRRGVEAFLARLDAVVVPWDQAVASRFDLIVAASENDRLEQLTGPILLVPHGIGFQKHYPGGRTVAGMNPDRLIHNGDVVPTTIGISHVDQHAQLAARCPPAASRTALIGDPALDRLLASRHRRPQYRADLGGTGRTVVLLASTWGPESLLGRFPHLPEQVAKALPVDEYRVAAVLHPGVWAAHSAWQIRAWLARATAAGVQVISPDRWQSALIAADCVVSDQGSIALYAAALDVPLLLTPGDSAQTVPDSPLALLAAKATRLDVTGDLSHQFGSLGAAYPDRTWRDLALTAAGQPGESAPILRALLYRLLDLPEPGEAAEFPPADPPPGSAEPPVALVVGATEQDDNDDNIVVLHRFPAAEHGPPRPDLDYRHLAVDVTQGSFRQLAAASVLICRDPNDFLATATELLARWPDARLVATVRDPATCLVCTRDELLAMTTLAHPAGFDPSLLASLAFVRTSQRRPLVGQHNLRLGDEVVTVQAGRPSRASSDTAPHGDVRH